MARPLSERMTPVSQDDVFFLLKEQAETRIGSLFMGLIIYGGKLSPQMPAPDSVTALDDGRVTQLGIVGARSPGRAFGHKGVMYYSCGVTGAPISFAERYSSFRV